MYTRLCSDGVYLVWVPKKTHSLLFKNPFRDKLFKYTLFTKENYLAFFMQPVHLLQECHALDVTLIIYSYYIFLHFVRFKQRR